MTTRRSLRDSESHDTSPPRDPSLGPDRPAGVWGLEAHGVVRDTVDHAPALAAIGGERGTGEADGDDGGGPSEERRRGQIPDGQRSFRDAPGAPAVVCQDDIRESAAHHLVVAADGDALASVAKGE